MITSYQLARTLIDQAHSADPERTAEGLPAELVYADRVEHWVKTLSPDASEVLLLAARCQHLERWSVPRDSFPLDRVGYLSWRKHLYQVQADRARELLLEAGVQEDEADSVHRWVSKTGLKSDPGTQLLEDGAVLVFLEHHIADFAASHGEYPREKFIGILKKTWRKISPDAQAAAGQLSLAPVIQELIAEALADGSGS